MKSAANKKKLVYFSLSITLIIAISLIVLFITRPYKVGVILSLDSSIGYEENIAIQFYNDEFPRIGLRKVNLIVENPSLNPEEITNSFHRLKDEKVSVIIGGAISFEGVLISKLAAEHGIPVISPSTSSSLVTGLEDNFYRISATNYIQGKYAAKYLNESGSHKVVLLLSTQNRSYSEPLADAFIKELDGEGIKIFNDPLNPDPSIVIEHDPDYIFFILPANETISYINIFRDQLPETGLMTTTWGYQQLLSVFSGKLLNNMIVTTTNDKEMLEPYKSYSDEISEVYTLQTSFASGLGLTAIIKLYDALKVAGDNPTSIIDYMNRDKYLNGPYGKIFMNRFGDSYPEKYFIFEIQNDKLIIESTYPIEEFQNEEE